MARAYEQSGDLESAQKTLDRLVKDYPATRYATRRSSAAASCCSPPRTTPAPRRRSPPSSPRPDASPYQDRSLYMLGWSQYKQGRLEDGLKSFFGVLDLKVAGKEGETGLDAIAGLTPRRPRAGRGHLPRRQHQPREPARAPESIPRVHRRRRRGKTYEFRVYEQLGELYIKQERTKDAADTFSLFARRNPLHAQAPVMQARVIEIYEKSGFTNQAIEAKKEYVARYGRTSEFRRVNPEGWDKAQPLVKTHLAELARHYHATAQKTKSSADSQEAVRWYREYLVVLPDRPGGGAEQLPARRAAVRGQPLRRGQRSSTRRSAYGYPKHDEERRRRLRRAARLRAAAEEGAARRAAGAAALERRQRAALRHGLARPTAQRPGARPMRPRSSTR